MKFTKYKLMNEIIPTPEIELPEGSLVVSVKHHGGYTFKGGILVPECWQVTWLEPVEGG